MPWPKTLILVRHAESEGNIMGVNERAQALVANYRFPLTPRGRQQAALTGSHLRRAFGEFDKHYCSYYERARQTLDIMFPDCKKIEDPRLAEGQRGIWHTMTLNQVKLRFPEEIERKEKEDLYHYRPLGGENWPDIELRIHSFLDMLQRDCGGQKVLVVTHGHWLILFQKIMQCLSIEEAMRQLDLGVFENASVMVYRTRNKPTDLRLSEKDIVPWQGLI
ncbi:histidine phosphatase family protein [Candidatus Falkowbacteria bacterium]|nr:histidine phosphatase family protein [Candidatus Falkowbacteria bacterium]